MALARALDDLRPALDEVAALSVPEYVDLCAVEVVDLDGNDRLLVTKGSAGLTIGGGFSPLSDAWALGPAAVLGRGQCYERVALRRAREQLGAGSAIWAPIATERRTFGALILANAAGGHQLGVADIELAKDLSIRIATAAERVRLYKESVARAASQAALAEGLRHIGSLAASLAGAVTSEAVLQTACTDACAIFDADAVAACWTASPKSQVTVGDVDPDHARAALDAALSGRPDPPGWITTLMSGTEGQRGAVAVQARRGLSSEQQLLLASLAAVIRVALERAATTEAWHKHETELEAVLNAAPVAILTVRRDGTVAAANRRGRQVFGWPSRGTELCFPDDVRPAMVQVATDALVRGTVADRPVSSDNLDLLVAGVPFHAAPRGEPAVLVVATDLGEERRVERVLLQAQRLEAMGQVAGGVAHDFNNLLTVMIGYTALLRRRLEDHQGLDELDQLEVAVKRAADLTRKLLGFARRQLDEPVTVDLALATRQLHELLQTVAGPDITVELDAPDEAVPILADPATVEQMVLNLSINARDAMDGRGHLWLTVDRVELDSEQCASLGLAPGDYARLSVADDGAGMTDEIRARCLEPFFTTKDRGMGSGLGLSTVYGQAVGYGGTLTIDTRLGQGTTVRVWLPVGATGADRQPAARAPAAQSRLSGRILLVDDQDELRGLAVQALADAGLEVTGVGNPEAALALAEQSWDVLVTDIVLPGMSGVDLATRMRTLHPGLPVLFVSGYADSQTSRWRLVEGSHLLRKPYGPDVLCRRVGDLLGHGSKR